MLDPIWLRMASKSAPSDFRRVPRGSLRSAPEAQAPFLKPLEALGESLGSLWESLGNLWGLSENSGNPWEPLGLTTTSTAATTTNMIAI